MPVQGNPGRTLTTAVEGVQNDKRARELGKQTIQSGISTEVIQEVLPNGAYRVAGRELFTTGDAKGLLAGMIVPVAWRNGEPQAILDHNARRAQFSPPRSVGKPEIEMLLAGPNVAGDISGTKLDVWFRNQNQTTLLDVRKQIAAAGFVGGAPGFPSIIGLELLGWGLDQRRFAVSFTNPVAQGVNKSIIAVFKFKHPRSVITGQAKAVLERTYDLSTFTQPLGVTTGWTGSRIGIGAVFGTMNTTLGQAAGLGHFLYMFANTPTTIQVLTNVGTSHQSVAGFQGNLQVITAGVGQVVITKNRHLIANFNVRVQNAPNGEGAAASLTWTYPFIVDLTSGAVLFNGFLARGTWGPLDASLYDGLIFSTATFGPLLSFKGGAAARMVPTKAGNVLRFFATGSGSAGNGATFKWAGVRLNLGSVVMVFQESSAGATAAAVVRAVNERHVMWLRVGNVVPPPVLSNYDFKDGLHITDLGPGEVLAVTDSIVLTDRDTIIAFMNEAPYFVRPQFLWLGTNDLRTVEPDGAEALAALLVAAGLAGVSAGPRRKTRFASYTAEAGAPRVPIAPPVSGSSPIILPAGPPVKDLKPIPTKVAFLAVDVIDNYDVSGHQDPVVGQETYVSNPGRSAVQFMTPS